MSEHKRTSVTKKEGPIERTTHLLWPTNLVDWTLLIFSTHTKLQTFSHSNYWPALSSPSHRSEMYRHNNTTNLKHPSSSSPFTQVSNKETFHCIYKICIIPKAQALRTSEDSQNNSFSVVPTLFLFLSNSSVATATIWLTTRRSRNSGVQPKSPSHRALHHRHVHPTTKLLQFQLLQIHTSPKIILLIPF